MDVRTTVVAEVPLVEAARSQPSSTVTQRQIDALPVLERNFLVLAQLLPGSGPINSTVNRFAVTKFGGVGDQRSGYTTLIDGGDVDDAQWGSPTINVSQDAVQEFKVFRSQFDAQYGHALNAVVTVATRSGTNRFAGSGFYFGRDDALNARNPFATTSRRSTSIESAGRSAARWCAIAAHFFAAYERDTVDNVRIIALPPSNPLAATENGVLPGGVRRADGDARLDHRFNATHALSLRYNHEDQRSLRSARSLTSDTNQMDVFNRSHSLVVEETWSPTQNVANAFRVHLEPHARHGRAEHDVGIVRPSGNDRPDQSRLAGGAADQIQRVRHVLLHIGTARPQVRRRIRVQPHTTSTHTSSSTAYFSSRPTRRSMRMCRAHGRRVPAAEADAFTYRLAGTGRVSAGRLAARQPDSAQRRRPIRPRPQPPAERLLRTACWTIRAWPASGNSSARDRGTDTNNVQPRLGATWDARGDGRMIVRGGSGVYVTRNRPWFQLRSMNQVGSSVVRITDATLLRNYPDITAVLGGRSLDSFIAAGRSASARHGDSRRFRPAVRGEHHRGRRMADQQTDRARCRLRPFVWQPSDRIDRSQPAAERCDHDGESAARAAIRAGGDARELHQELVRRARDAAPEAPRLADSLQVSYTLSRSYLDGVDFFLTTRGTQRTPHERGYNPTDQRHNLTVAGIDHPAVGTAGQRNPETGQRIADQGAGRPRSRRRS